MKKSLIIVLNTQNSVYRLHIFTFWYECDIKKGRFSLNFVEQSKFIFIIKLEKNK